MSEGTLVVEGILSTRSEGTLSPHTELDRFLREFASNEAKDFCKVTLHFDHESYRGRPLCFITIDVKGEWGVSSLRRSFNDGALRHWKLAQKFKIPELATQAT